MAKDRLKAALEKKGPDALRLQAATNRQAISPVDIIAAAAVPAPSITQESEPEETATGELGILHQEERTEKANDKATIIVSSDKLHVKSDKKKGSKITHQKDAYKRRTGKPRIHSERDIHALLTVDKRPTERYSFEIYTDQKDDIQHVCDLYEKSTGKKLSASRFIREVLDYVLPGALEAFVDNQE